MTATATRRGVMLTVHSLIPCPDDCYEHCHAPLPQRLGGKVYGCSFSPKAGWADERCTHHSIDPKVIAHRMKRYGRRARSEREREMARTPPVNVHTLLRMTVIEFETLRMVAEGLAS